VRVQNEPNSSGEGSENPNAGSENLEPANDGTSNNDNINIPDNLTIPPTPTSEE